MIRKSVQTDSDSDSGHYVNVNPNSYNTGCNFSVYEVMMHIFCPAIWFIRKKMAKKYITISNQEGFTNRLGGIQE